MKLGKPKDFVKISNLAALKLAVKELSSFIPHMDNTGADCRIDFQGHDCCYTCNLAQEVVKAWRDLNEWD